MRELIEAKCCNLHDIQVEMDEDLGCNNCITYDACLEEPNPHKCSALIFLRWWKDEVHTSNQKVN